MSANYRIETTITTGDLTAGTWVEGESTGYTQADRVAFTSTWAGTFDRIAKDTHGGDEMYAYFKGGHINGIEQGTHGFPAAHLGS